MGNIDSVSAIIRVHGVERAQHTALVQGERRLTWAQLYERARRMAGLLAANGVGPQDRVAFLDKNGIEHFEVFYGAALLNAVCVDVNWRLAAPEVEYIVNDAQAKVFVVGKDMVPILDAIAPTLTTVAKILVIDGDGRYPDYEAEVAAHADVDPGVPSLESDVAFQLLILWLQRIAEIVGPFLTDLVEQRFCRLHRGERSVELAAEAPDLSQFDQLNEVAEFFGDLVLLFGEAVPGRGNLRLKSPQPVGDQFGFKIRVRCREFLNPALRLKIAADGEGPLPCDRELITDLIPAVCAYPFCRWIIVLPSRKGSEADEQYREGEGGVSNESHLAETKNDSEFWQANQPLQLRKWQALN